MSQLAFYFDQTRCMACNACTVACKDWNQINPGPVAWRKQFTYEWNFGEGLSFFPFSNSCNHCDTPACLGACPYQAIVKDENNGVVMVDRAKCQGLKACITACPFAKPMIAENKQEPTPVQGWQIRHPMQKCTLCSTDKLENGLKPTCVLACVGRALDVDTVEEIQATYGSDPDFVRLNPNDFPYLYINNQNDTKPNLFIRKMKKTGGGMGGLKVHKSSDYTGKY